MQEPTETLVDEFHRVARNLLRTDEARHSIVTGDLVNGALLRLYRRGEDEGLSRQEVLGGLVLEMRRELVDRARRRKSAKRGEGQRPAQLDQDFESTRGLGPLGTLEVHEALETLEALDAHQARVVELRFFGGFTNAQIADALGCSVRTVGSTWRFARAWLLQRFAEEADGRA